MSSPAVGLDLGSTRFKAGVLDERGRLSPVLSVAAPALAGEGARREGDARAYVRAATELLERAAEGLPQGTPLGVASQRSTFTLWDRDSGEARAPMISWQDRRAADWCARHRELEPEIFERTGLVLSAHYAGPKLATLQEGDPALARALRGGRLLFGNLETYLLWHWSGGDVHETDPTMAARTSMFDLRTGEWADALLDRFGVPRDVLPQVRATAGRGLALDCGLTLQATVADQASGALAVLGEGDAAALINLGTGAFVLRPSSRDERRQGYLAALIHGGPPRERHVLEGTINGAGATVDRYGPGPTVLPLRDPAPRALCLPDAAGLGSPFWRPDLGLTFSRAAEGLPAGERRRVVLEGVIFRVRQVLRGLTDAPPPRIFLAGGLAREPFIAAGLAALLGRDVEVLELREAGLIGVTRLAAGLSPCAEPPTRTVAPGPAGAYLAEKNERWTAWLDSIL